MTWLVDCSDYVAYDKCSKLSVTHITYTRCKPCPRLIKEQNLYVVLHLGAAYRYFYKFIIAEIWVERYGLIYVLVLATIPFCPSPGATPSAVGVPLSHQTSNGRLSFPDNGQCGRGLAQPNGYLAASRARIVFTIHLLLSRTPPNCGHKAAG